MKSSHFVAAICGVFVISVTSARAQHVDIRPYVRDGAIVTGSAELVGGVVTPVSDHQRVFGADFGEDDPGQPFLSEDPGFLAEDGAFPGGAGKFVGFNALSGLAYWTGSGFGAVPAGESLQVTKGSQTVNVGSSAAAGFYFALIDAGGGLHDHLSFELLGSDGNPIPGDGVEPTPGIYLLAMELTTNLAGVGNSEPFWAVFNNGDDEANHDAAIEWVEANYVPEPATALLLLAGAGPGALRRGRR